MTHEIELKLSLPPAQASRLSRNPLLRSLARRRAVTRRLTSVYFDTPDLKLAAHGMALRVRQIGGKRLQTLKLPVDFDTGLQIHREIEFEIDGDTPILSSIDDAPLQAFFTANAIAGQLAAVFVTEFDRRLWPLQMFDSEIDLALDQGVIRSGERSMPLSEAELELKSGRPERLYELALALHGTVPFTLESRTKSARGYALFSGTMAEPQRAAPVRLDAEMSGARAFVEIARNCASQLRANEEPARQGEDPEGIHQMRVAVRRLRALVGIFRDDLDGPVHAFLSAGLRWLQRQLGPARDWDVFIAGTVEPLHRHLATELAVETMRRDAHALRDDAYATAIAALSAPRYTELLLKLELWLDSGAWAAPLHAGLPPRPLSGPVGDFAVEVLQKRHKRMRRYGGKRAELSESELHRLRLLCKKTRYAVEFFRELFPRKAVKRYHAALVEIQETLGSLNDAAVSRQLIAELERRMAASVPAQTPRAVGIVLGWQAACIDRDIGRFRAVWDRFHAAKPFWSRG
jgi:inorganic triphosphatase YgiF